MKPEIKERFNESILHETIRRYGIAPRDIRLLDGFESFIYEFEREGVEYILRIGHSLRRNEALIHGEVDWMNYLAQGGASVAKAMRSESGNLVERIDDGQGEHFLATAFVKAKGQAPQPDDWTPALFENYGRLLGKIHALSKEYIPADSAWKRPEWDDTLIMEVERNLPPSESRAVEKFQVVMERLKRLPKERASYGMIHYDAHSGNFFVDEQGRLTLFDFDDCSYGWFAYDIAIVLFYMATGVEKPPEFTGTFMPSFLKGYSQENRFDPEWLKEIPYFLKLREIDLYAIIHRSFDVEHLKDPWCVRYMRNRRANIENDTPYIDFDFESLREYL